MVMDLKGKVALVTGGAAGIGRAYCEELLKFGAKVSICDINDSVGEDLAEQWRTKYGPNRAIYCPCDVTDYPQFEEAFQITLQKLGGLDIVINNAGIFNDRFWELEVDVNLNGIIRGTLLAQSFMGADRRGGTGRGGTIVMTASTLGFVPNASAPIYSATKHAIVAFARAMGDQFHQSQTGIRVIALCPGPTQTSTTPEDMRAALLSDKYEALFKRDFASQNFQSAQSVGQALIHVLQKGTSGSVWAVENNQIPREVKFPANYY
ncbi:hypothetical protein M8J76_008195 [Diaphorina citri]|nr:hypothetical protein M8J76_008195 [Diaphorina citri]KAI5720093.1 hypothetical protein M8J77_001752 [Diaphorina citri]